jgi:uncharacterized membrane protein (UPF0182 family)
MRVTSADVSRRPLGLRGWLIGAAVVLVILLFSLRGLARFYTDYLWFREVGFDDTWRQLLSAKALPALIFSAIFFAVMLVNLIVADRIAPRYRSAAGPEDEIIERYRTYVAPYSGRLRVGVSLFFALVMGGGVSAEWRSWILFRNAVDFGQDDAQFGRDLGFYVFRLPFLEFVVGWTFAALLVVLIVTAVFHYLNGGIRIQSPWQRVTPQVKVHLSVILALMALTKTVQYYLARYELVFSRRGFVDGASYTDVKAQLPALNLLMIISVAAAALFIANIFRKGWVFPVIAVGLWAFISLVVGTIYPAVIQRFVVQPNEFSREEPYIERNITSTREAFGLGDDEIETQGFDYTVDLDQADVERNEATLGNIRLWDPAQLQEVYRAQQERFPFYRFNDADADRYVAGADTIPTMISLRELDAEGIPDRTWTNRHLVYTHGYAPVASAANLVDAGEPSYLASDIPPEGELSAPEQLGIYFGEQMSGYVAVGTKVAEQEPSAEGDATEPTAYSGAAGVEVSSFLRKAALALRFGDWNLFVSGQIDGDSRVLYKRDIRERVSTAAPFLRFDADPYPVVVDGQILWVIDAYTISDRFPYSQTLNPSNLPDGSGLDTDFNYVRNSVKATVDAYDGTITFYVLDPDNDGRIEDPIIRAYQKAFPELFTPQSEMPEGLRDHWRYPEDLFRAQTEHFSTYHMTDASDFFRKAFIWDVAPRPERATTAATSATTGTGSDGGRNTTLAASDSPIDPLYLQMQLPGEPDQEFVLMRPFVPRGRPNQLSAFMVARSDGADYGKLISYEIPSTELVPSPAEAATLIESDPFISSVFTPLDLRGSEVIRGNVQLLPLGNSIVYVRPVYVEGQGEGQFPRLRFVALAYGGRSTLVDFQGEEIEFTTVQQALQGLVAGEVPTEPTEPTEPSEPSEPTEPGATTTTPTTRPPPSGSVDELLADAAAALDAAEAALDAGDLGEYQAQVSEAKRLLDAARALTAPTTTAGG